MCECLFIKRAGKQIRQGSVLRRNADKKVRPVPVYLAQSVALRRSESKPKVEENAPQTNMFTVT